MSEARTTHLVWMQAMLVTTTLLSLCSDQEITSVIMMRDVNPMVTKEDVSEAVDESYLMYTRYNAMRETTTHVFVCIFNS